MSAQTQVVALDVSDSLRDALSSVASFVPKLAGFLVILLIGWLVARLLRTLVGKLLERLHFDRAVERGGLGRFSGGAMKASGLVASLVYYGILLIALQMAFGVFGPNPVS